MWARLIDSNDLEFRVWITRRLCSQACKTIVRILEETTPPTDIGKNQIRLSSEAILAEEHESSLKKPSDPAPEKKNKKKNQNGLIEMCYSIEIASNAENWQIKFISQNPSKGFKINTDRQNIHRILSALLFQSKQANWSIEVQAKWLNEQLR